MLTAILLTVIAILVFCLCLSGFYLLRFARIILAIQDTLGEALEDFDTVEKSLEALMKMQMFFESKEVKQAVTTALDDVILSKMIIVRTIKNFTRLSKEQYEMVEVDAENDKESP